MSEILLVNYAPWHRCRSQQPRTFEQFCQMVCADPLYAGKPKGLREYIETDVRTGDVLRRVWNQNVLLDIGAQSMLQRAINSSSASLPPLFNNLLITNNSGSTTLRGTGNVLVSGSTYTTIPVNSLPAAIPATTGGSPTLVTIGFGSGQTQDAQLSAGAAQGATSISVVAVGGGTFTANANYTSSAAVVPKPHVAENPAAGTTAGQLMGNQSSPLTSYSGNLATLNFTYTPNTGNGNRQVLVSFDFNTSANGGNTPAGAYTDCWVVNVSSAASSGNYMSHDINVPLTCNNSTKLTANVTIQV